MIDRSNPGPRVHAHQATGRGTARIPYPTEIRTVRITARTEVTPYLLRLTVAGPDLADLHSYACDDHVGIVFPLPDGTRSDPVFNPERQALDWPSPSPSMRKYTIRRHDRGAAELDLDIVLHPGGLASDWATAAQVGDEAVLAGPPGSLAFSHTYARYLFALDSTAVPAFARWLDEGDWIEERGVTVHAVIDHDHPAEVAYPLHVRDGVTVEWHPRDRGSRLADVVSGLDIGRDPADVFLFAAGEANDIKPLRRWAKEQGIDALVTGYWKRGEVEFDREDHDHDHDGHDHEQA